MATKVAAKPAAKKVTKAAPKTAVRLDAIAQLKEDHQKVRATTSPEKTPAMPSIALARMPN